MRFKATIIAGVCWAALAAAAQATVLPYKSFDRLVDESEGIVIGTVRSVETAAARNANDLYTYVTIEQLDVLRGKVAQATLTLRLKGGFDGRQGLHVEGAPQFAPKERVLLFVQGNGRDLVPFVGWSQGVFRLVDAAGGGQQVRDADGNAVIGVDAGQVMRRPGERLDTDIVGAPDVQRQRSAAPRAGGGTTDNGSAVTELGVEAAAQAPMAAERFVAAVRERAGAAAAAAGTLRSVTAQDSQRSDANGKDGTAVRAPVAERPVAMPSGNSLALPAERKAPSAPEAR